MQRILIATVLAAFFAGATFTTIAADKPAEGKPAAKEKYRPFNGTIKAFNATASTLTLEGESAQTFLITSKTTIRKDGKTATTEALAAGEKVGGRAKETADGKWEAVTINVGKAPAGGKPKKEEKKTS